MDELATQPSPTVSSISDVGFLTAPRLTHLKLDQLITRFWRTVQPLSSGWERYRLGPLGSFGFGGEIAELDLPPSVHISTYIRCRLGLH